MACSRFLPLLPFLLPHAVLQLHRHARSGVVHTVQLRRVARGSEQGESVGVKGAFLRFPRHGPIQECNHHRCHGQRCTTTHSRHMTHESAALSA